MLRLLLVFLVACGSSPSLTGDDAPAVDAAADGAPDAGTCGRRGGLRGMSRREVSIDGLRRTYLVYLPASAEPTLPVPLVVVFHGYSMSGQAMHDITGYAALADEEHIALAFPDGQGGPDVNAAPWNVGTNLCPSSLGAPASAAGDDFALLEAMKSDIAADQCVDSDHVFVTGFSMGGYFSHHAGCMRDDIRAVAPHSGGAHPLDGCTTQRKPIIMFHGAADTLIPLGCSDPAATPVSNVVPAATAWAQRNGCDLTTTTVLVPGGTCRIYNNCPAGGQVELCTFTGMGHCWAGGAVGAGVFSCPAYANATAIEWKFFKDHAW